MKEECEDKKKEKIEAAEAELQQCKAAAAEAEAAAPAAEDCTKPKRVDKKCQDLGRGDKCACNMYIEDTGKTCKDRQTTRKKWTRCVEQAR